MTELPNIRREIVNKFHNIFNNITKSANVTTFYIDNIPYFKCKDLLKCLKYSDKKYNLNKKIQNLKLINNHFCITLNDALIINNVWSKNINLPEQDIDENLKEYFLTLEGLNYLITKTRKTVPDELYSFLKENNVVIDYGKIYLNRRQIVISCIINTFSNLKYRYPFIVKIKNNTSQIQRINIFKIDLYFLDYDLAIDCYKDNRQTQAIKLREHLIKKKLNCTFIKFNPNSKKLNIFEIIDQIHSFIANYKENYGF